VTSITIKLLEAGKTRPDPFHRRVGGSQNRAELSGKDKCAGIWIAMFSFAASCSRMNAYQHRGNNLIFNTKNNK